MTKRPEPTSGTSLWERDISPPMVAYAIAMIVTVAFVSMFGFGLYAAHPVACDDVRGEVVTLRETGLDSYGNYRVVFTVRYEIDGRPMAETFDMDADQFYANPLVLGDRLEMQAVQFNRLPPQACLGDCHYRICWEER